MDVLKHLVDYGIIGLLLALSLPAADAVFSHKTHQPLKLKCSTCHIGAEKEERASLPKIEQCQTCHTSMTEKPQAQPATKLPDFVVFSHVQHAIAKLDCNSCHGDAYQQTTTVTKPLRMKACVDCHKQHKATIACNVCHELGQ